MYVFVPHLLCILLNPISVCALMQGLLHQCLLTLQTESLKDYHENTVEKLVLGSNLHSSASPRITHTPEHHLTQSTSINFILCKLRCGSLRHRTTSSSHTQPCCLLAGSLELKVLGSTHSHQLTIM